MKKILFFSLILLLTRVSSLHAVEPSCVTELQRQALKEAGLERTQVGQWRRKVRQSAWLPRFQIGADRTIRNNLDIQLDDSVSVSSAGVVVGPEESQQVVTQNRNINFEAKAVWDLSELVFSRDDLAISQEARNRVRERDRLLSQINKNYFDWVRLKGKRNAALQMDLLAANLDGLTNGWFSSYCKSGHGS